MTYINNLSQQEAFIAKEGYPATEMTPRDKLTNKENSLFGQDGFTFFDFLDIINPLQHIPVISTIYRSITGDKIDPGSQIAGATLFGGPLGGILASMDVAIKNNTGQDIADHTATFFAGGLVSVQKAINPSIPNIATTVTSNSAEPKNIQLPPQEESSPVLKLNKTPNNRFDSAGMTAIPIIKNTDLTLTQVPKSFDPLKLYGNPEAQKHKTAGPTFSGGKLFDQDSTPHLDPPAKKQPQALSPRFSTNSVTSGGTYENTTSSKTKEGGGHVGSEALIKDSWAIDAMLRGLGEYNSTKRLINTPYRPTYSVNH